MKKTLAILLALVVVGGAAFAQVTVAAGASGTVYLVDQDGKASFARDGSGYDVLTFKASKDKSSFAFNVDNYDKYADGTGADFLIRDWNYTTANDFAKVIVGKVRNGDFRSAMANGWYANVGATDRFFNGANYGIVAETQSLGALTLGLGLPIPEAGVVSTDMLKMTNVGASYAIANIGTVKALGELDLRDGKNSRVAGSFELSAVKDLSATLYAVSVLADAPTLFVAGSAYYTMGKLFVGAEAEYFNKFVTSSATYDGFDVNGKIAYSVTDSLTGWAKGGLNVDKTTQVYAGIDYGFIPGLTATAQIGYTDAIQGNVNISYAFAY